MLYNVFGPNFRRFGLFRFWDGFFGLCLGPVDAVFAAEGRYRPVAVEIVSRLILKRKREPFMGRRNRLTSVVVG